MSMERFENKSDDQLRAELRSSGSHLHVFDVRADPEWFDTLRARMDRRAQERRDGERHLRGDRLH